MSPCDDSVTPATRRPSLMIRASPGLRSRPAQLSMRHRNEYSYYHDNTQNSAIGQVGERPCVIVPAPFNRDWLTIHKLADRVTDVSHKIGDALGAERVRRVVYVAEPAASCTSSSRPHAPRSRPWHRHPERPDEARQEHTIMSSGQRPRPYPIAGAWGRVGWGDLDYRIVVLQTDVMMCDNACMGPRKVDRGHARDVDRSRPRAAVTQEG